MPKKHKKPKLKEVNPDKVGRGHAFGAAGSGRSTRFKSKKDYCRKTKKNSKLEN